MIPRYRFEAIRDDADRLIYEESPNYDNAFICLGFGIALLAVGFLGLRFYAADLSERKPFASAVFGGFIFCCLAASYCVSSTISLDRQQHTIAIRRHFIWLHWTSQYRVEEIERFFEAAAPREKDKRLLAMELTNGRTKKVTLWGMRSSFSDEEIRLNAILKIFRQDLALKAGHVHSSLTDDQRRTHTLENARTDLRKHLRRMMYSMTGLSVTAAMLVPFLYGNPLHPYWNSVGTVLFLVSTGFFLALVLEAATSWIGWLYVRDLNKIDKRYDPRNQHGNDEP